ncbi:MAG: D-Ala-D-Ala carboxypeptidase family metallohydrolase [Rhizobiaceae bacterium]
MAQLIGLFLIGLMLSACVSSNPTINIQSLADISEEENASLQEATVAVGGEFIDPAGSPVVPIKAPRTNSDDIQTASVAKPDSAPATKNVPLSSNQPVKPFFKKPEPSSKLALLNDGVKSSNSKRKNSFFERLFQKPEKKSKSRSAKRSRSEASGSALPGVKSSASLFGVGGEDQEVESQVQLASIGGLGRISPNGLRLQHSKVQVSCFKPELLRLLKRVHRKFGKAPIVTSGYRSPRRNRRAGGVSRSQHIYCKAADIQVENVSKWTLAKYLRTLPGRGGVGTYCRTKSVHIDVGSKRDWHYPCRRRSSRKKRKS